MTNLGLNSTSHITYMCMREILYPKDTNLTGLEINVYKNR